MCAGALLLAAMLAWLVHPRPSDRQQIEDLLHRGEHGIDTKNVSEIMDCVAPNYRDGEHVSRADLQRMVLGWARVSEQGNVTIEDCRLDLHSTRGTGKLKVVFDLMGQGGKTSLPMELKISFAKERRGWHRVWLITSVDGYREGNMMEGISD